jgi:type IX secretion system PorP/SprF family membrane protein
MRRPLYLIILFICIINLAPLKAQQDPMFTKYIFNPLAYNPAYAGTTGYLDMAVLHRHQWWGMKGAPMTQNLTMHSFIPKQNIGLGLNTSMDQIAVFRQFNIYGSFSYRLALGKRYHRHRKSRQPNTFLYMGMQGGVSNFNADWSKLDYANYDDPAFNNQQPLNLWMPNFGAGFYLQAPKWFLGFSSPMLVEHTFRRRESFEPITIPVAQSYRHFYLSGGAIIPLQGEDLVLRPILLIKNVGMFTATNSADGRVNAPSEFDIDLSLVYKKKFWFGVAFRSAFNFKFSSYDSIDFWFSVRMKNKMRIGLGYDLTLTRLRGPAQGTYELMMGYDMIPVPIVNHADMRPYKWF